MKYLVKYKIGVTTFYIKIDIPENYCKSKETIKYYWSFFSDYRGFKFLDAVKVESELMFAI